MKRTFGDNPGMMLLNVPSSFPRWMSALVWLLVGFSACAWYLRTQGVAQTVVTQLPPSTPWPDPDSAQVANALGGMIPTAGKASLPISTLDASRFALKGVIDRGQGRGVALISLDSKPAKPIATGGAIADGIVLVRVQGQSAWIAADQSRQEGIELLLLAAPVVANKLGTVAPLH